MNAAVRRSLTALEALYPDAATELHYHTPFELLVATMLSAQCTDKRVNLITPRLFSRYPGVDDLAQAEVSDIEELIRDCGLYHTKARNIRETARLIRDQYGGQVPSERDLLMTLPGVGRKTANVVIANAFGQDAIAVDTHVFRLAHRLGWSRASDAIGTERDLMAVIAQPYWSKAHHWLILHGRRVCQARRPLCHECVLAADCPRVGVVTLGERAMP